MNKLKFIFSLYKPAGILRAVLITLRVMILPYSKLNSIIPKSGKIIDIGCGSGGLAHYLILSSTKRQVIGLDLSKQRIKYAKKTLESFKYRRNISFTSKNVINTHLPQADCYLLIDMLHHISISDQLKLLKKISSQLKQNSVMIIKDVDKSNYLPFLFGHIIEKILYPKENIYARSREEWLKLFDSLNLSCKVYGGAFYFPDSTLIFECRRKLN